MKKIRFEEEIRLKKIRLEEMVGKMFSMEDWEKMTIEEVKMRWGNRRKELEEVEKKKAEREKKIDEAKKKKEEKRKRAIRERRCFVCGIFGHMVRYCKNRGEEKRGSSMPQNKFEVLKDKLMQRGEGSGKKEVKDHREILREEKERKMKIKVQKKDLEKEKEKKEEEEDKGQRRPKIEKEKIEVEREVEMRGFSGGEILKGRYPLAWWKMRCYECGGLGHRKRDHGKIEKRKDKIEKDKKKEIAREEKEKDRKIEKKDEEGKEEEERYRDRDRESRDSKGKGEERC